MHPDDSDVIVVTEDEVGERLDKLLAKRFNERYSRTYFQYLIDEHLVLLNGSAVKKRVKPQTGDEIEVQFAATPEIQLIPEAIPLSIIYEDDYLIAINKPPGMVVHPAPGHWTGTFVNALLYHCEALKECDSSTLRPGIVHRLDKETSGILVAAKTLETQQKLAALFASRQVYKEYWAICIGKVEDGEIRAPIGRHPILRKQMAVIPTGREALSLCKTVGWNDKLSLVQIVIATGRTHQIRVHLKYRGHAILGDTLYGNSSINHHYGVQRQLLHAKTVRFTHPITHQEIEISAPILPDMMRFIRKILPSDCYKNLSRYD